MERDVILLSVLICHLLERKQKLARVKSKLDAQAQGRSVEILVEGDNGEMTIGAKRNRLLERARGEYVVFVDDDDDVSDDYIDAILKALETRPDCVGIIGEIIIKGEAVAPFRHSIEYAGWYASMGTFFRTPNHLNPIKAELARSVGFDEHKSFGEDQEFSDNIRSLLETEVRIDRPIYFYHNYAPTEREVEDFYI